MRPSGTSWMPWVGDEVVDSAMAFRDVVGHESMLRLVGQAVARDTLPPSLLLVGPDGVGKRLVAISLAQVQNCAAASFDR